MHNAFTTRKTTRIEEINATLYEFQHIESGAEVLHVEADDDENVFCLSFKTYPESSNGVAHILEHTVLCGSKKYPVKDPFFTMIGRSLNTFMNAMTGSDFTCYPAASQVEKDFYNLLDVYMDCVFFPKLNKYSFMQEGHHLEFTDEKNTGSDLKFGGIVFNEMKGSLNSPDTRLWHFIFEHLFPGLTYQYNSGGDPKDIPDLTYEEFINFHRKFYDPSRCLFYFYGNLPVKNHLDYIHKNVLSIAKKQPSLPLIQKQTRFDKPKKIQGFYPLDDADTAQKTMLAFAWLTCPITNQEDLLALTLIDAILMDTDASPMKRNLLASKLCTQAQASMDTEISEIPYVIILKGTEKEHIEPLKKVIFGTLKEFVEKGIPHDLIEGAMHQLELSRLEINGDQYPYGLNLFWRCALMKQHGAEAADGLKIHSLFHQLKEKLKDKQYLPDLIRKYFLNNDHFLEVIFSPDKTLGQKELQEEKEKLKQIADRLSDKEKKQIVKEQRLLKKFQEEEESEEVMNCLPKVTLNDIPKKAKDYSLIHEKIKDIDLYYHDCFTNDFIYVDVQYPLGHIESSKLPYLQLFVSILTELGCKNRSYAENLSLIQQYTGGIGAGLSLHGHCELFDEIYPEFSIKGKCLKRNQVHLVNLIKDFLVHLRLDEKERIKELILQIYTHMQSRMNKHAMSYATKDALSPFSKLGALKNKLTGISYYHFICDIGKNLDSKIDDVIHQLESIKEQILHLNHPTTVLSCVRSDVIPEFFHILSDLPKQRYEAMKFDIAKEDKSSKAFMISSPVAFNVFAVPCIGFDHPLSGAMNILSDLISDVHLHKKIREQGGAYGSGASYHPFSHSFHFHSYRDPHISDTFHVFEEAIDLVTKGKFKESNIEEAIFEVVQDLDSPLSPGSRASLAYSWKKMHRTVEKRQKYRDSMVQVSKEELIEAAKILGKNCKHGKRVVFGSENLINEEFGKVDSSFIRLSTN